MSLWYPSGMRTTIRLPDDLLRRAKRLAASTDRSLTRLIEDALREALGRAEAAKPRGRVRLTTFGEGGTRPGVDLDDGRGLRDRMDAADMGR